ncbi:MAG: hypothetical protein ACTSRS_13810 [Candidatus Helarchaeota archaeon]
MELELRNFTTIDYNAIAKIYQKTLNYKRQLKDEDFVIFTPEYTEYAIKMAFPDLDLFFGIYSENKLVGTIGGSKVRLSFQGLELWGSAITSYAIDPDLFPIERDVLKDLFHQLIEKIKVKGIDLIWVIIIKENNANELKIFREDLGFTRLNKNVESLVKLLGSEGVEILKEKKEMNIVLAKMAKMMAGMQQASLPGGEIRNASSDDYPQIITLLNGYTETLPLSQIWTIDSFQQYILSNELLNKIDYSDQQKEYPNTPFGFHIKVWERESKIIAAILFRVVCINFKNGDAPFGFWDYVAFSQNLDIEEKKAFLINMYNELHLKTIIINAFLPYYEYKTFDKAGFMTERRKTPLLVLPLTKNGQKILELERLKEFYLPTLTDFAI